MPTGFKEDFGFIREEQRGSFQWGKQTVRETRRVECHNVTDDLFHLQDTLPGYGTPGEPITYTIGLSPHPRRANLVLRDVTGIERCSEDRGGSFWDISLEYATPDFMSGEGTSESKRQKRRDQRIDQNNRVIVYPWDEPPIWSSTSRETLVDRWKDANGLQLIHTNGLPLQEPVRIPANLRGHNFTFNVRFDDFDYTNDFEPYEGMINSVPMKTFFGEDAEEFCVKLESIGFTEHYDTIDYQVPDNQSEQGGEQTFYENIRYISVNVSFLVDPAGFKISYISRHTLQYVDGFGPAPIQINSRGDIATAPWPLKPNGEAVPYTTLQDTDWSEDAGEVGYIDTGFPERVNLAIFCNKWNLRIPRP